LRDWLEKQRGEHERARGVTLARNVTGDGASNEDFTAENEVVAELRKNLTTFTETESESSRTGE